MSTKLRRTSSATKNMVEYFSKFPYDSQLVCKGGRVGTHIAVLSTASKYIRDILAGIGTKGGPENPVLIILDFELKTLQSIKEFIYEGETTADAEVIRCASFLQLAESPVE